MKIRSIYMRKKRLNQIRKHNYFVSICSLPLLLLTSLIVMCFGQTRLGAFGVLVFLILLLISISIEKYCQKKLFPDDTV